jgi:peptidoglycan/LPS O-acetylase OafA/YrhL
MFHPIGPWVDGVYWTLAIEVVFYMLVSVFIACRQISRLEIVCIALGVYSSAFWISYLVGYFPQIFDRYAMLALCTHGVYFGLGALIWSATSRGWSAARILFAICFIIVGYTAIIFTTPGTTAFVPDDPSPHIPAVVWLCTALLIIASPLIETAVRGRLPQRLVEVINFAGLSTYALYLTHDAIGAIIMRATVVFGAGRWTALMATILAVIFLAVIITRYIEPPMRKLLKQATSKLGLTARHT